MGSRKSFVRFAFRLSMRWLRAGRRQNSSGPEPLRPTGRRNDPPIGSPIWERRGIALAKWCKIPVMLNKMETEARQPNPANATNIITETGVELLNPDFGSGSGDPARQSRPQPMSAAKMHCLWCRRPFTARMTGGSPQRFCSTGHRQAFWVAARRWTMRAVEAGLLSVECLKASQTSVHAARTPFRSETTTGP